MFGLSDVFELCTAVILAVTATVNIIYVVLRRTASDVTTESSLNVINT